MIALFPDCERVYDWLNQNHRIYHNLSPEEALAVFRNDIGTRNDCLIHMVCTLFYGNDIYICNFNNVSNIFYQEVIPIKDLYLAINELCVSDKLVIDNNDA